MAVTALHTAATGMQALSTKIDVIANNIANADTVGYKASRANFQDLLYQLRAQPGVQTSDESASPLPTQIGLGVAVVVLNAAIYGWIWHRRRLHLPKREALWLRRRKRRLKTMRRFHQMGVP